MEAAAFELAPDWVCEVLSPSTEAVDRAEKMPIYARENVAHLWLVDPIEHMNEVYRLERERWSLLHVSCNGDKVRAEPFDAIELELDVLWAT